MDCLAPAEPEMGGWGALLPPAACGASSGGVAARPRLTPPYPPGTALPLPTALPAAPSPPPVEGDRPAAARRRLLGAARTDTDPRRCEKGPRLRAGGGRGPGPLRGGSAGGCAGRRGGRAEPSPPLPPPHGGLGGSFRNQRHWFNFVFFFFFPLSPRRRRNYPTCGSDTCSLPE